MAKNDDIKFSDFTTGEKIHMITVVARMAKRSLADDGSGRVLEDLKQKAARIEARALRRKQSGQ
ncbi:hypothetical protein HLK59_10170 [Streptomyces sp. S3(2020)]|uniref:DUF6257 family protein n=1 Tax=Streptomyces sp. S3(2020) TaxID=2732044 RepID=UPI0014881231|nr:DUF6257 family protein [Streptomyces sp. S3(2020)]NNN30722.1 hypothetical protein [Streptomyces sp. S3(2020)]